jgi:hypothetical protein
MAPKITTGRTKYTWHLLYSQITIKTPASDFGRLDIDVDVGI